MDRPPLHRLVDVVPALLATLLAVTVVGGFLARLTHPYDLEWMEGGMLAHAWRLQRGLPLYPDPGPDFVSFVYPPGYTALLAWLGGVFELGPPLGRAIGIAGTLGAVAALITGVARHGGSAFAGVIAGAAFLGTWPSSGAFFDLVRPDALSVGLLGWALVIGLERHRGAPVAAGLLLAAAFACKHNAAAYGFPMLLGIVARDGWRRGAHFGVSAAAPALLLTLFMQWISEGRFLAYILAVPASHPIVGARMVPGTPGELAAALGVAVIGAALLLLVRAPGFGGGRWVAGLAALGGLVGASALLLEFPRGVGDPGPLALGAVSVALGAAAGGALVALIGAARRGRLPWEWVYGVGVVVTALVTAALMRGHHGGFMNVLMPLHWVVAFAFGVAIARARRRWPSAGVQLVTAGLATAQLALQVQALDVQRLVPTVEDREAGDRVVQRIRERCDGPVLSPYAAWLPVQAGLEPSLHLIAVWDIQHKDGPFQPHVEVLRQAARSQHWACVIEGGRRPIGLEVGQHYRRAESLPVGGRALMPKTGWRVRPTELHVPRE